MRKAKAERGFTNRWLAREMGVSPNTVTRWMKGENLPQRPADMARLAELLHMDVDELVKDQGPGRLVPILGRATAGGLAADERPWREVARLTVDGLELKIEARRRAET